MRRRSRAHAHVRGSNCNPASCEATTTPEGLGRGNRATLGFRQGPRSLGTQAVGHPAQCLAIWRAIPLGRAGHGSVTPQPRQILQHASPQGEGAGNCAAGRWARVNVSPLWTLQCLSSGPDQMLRQPTLTAKRTMTRAGDVNGGLDRGAAIREPDQMLRQPTLTAKRTMTRAGDVN